MEVSGDSLEILAANFRDSGSIEQDADVVLMLHRESYYHRGDPDYDHDAPEASLAEVIIEKQRNGPTGIVELIFDSKTTRFKPRYHGDDPYDPF